MKKIFIKEHRASVTRYSFKYWLAVFIEISAIILWAVGLLEIKLYNRLNPADCLIHIGGLLFVIGSFLYAKWVKH